MKQGQRRRIMTCGLLIDTLGQIWPLLRPSGGRPGGAPDAASQPPGNLCLVLGPNGAEVSFSGESVSTRTLYKALRVLASWRPKRVALKQCNSGAVQVTLFRGVWEFAGHLETLATAPPGVAAPALTDQPCAASAASASVTASTVPASTTAAM